MQLLHRRGSREGESCFIATTSFSRKPLIILILLHRCAKETFHVSSLTRRPLHSHDPLVSCAVSVFVTNFVIMLSFVRPASLSLFLPASFHRCCCVQNRGSPHLAKLHFTKFRWYEDLQLNLRLWLGFLSESEVAHPKSLTNRNEYLRMKTETTKRKIAQSVHLTLHFWCAPCLRFPCFS